MASSPILFLTKEKRIMNKQKGFTLIELIMVIVVLGVLAAIALPKFVNLSGDARASIIKATEGSMRTANSIIYAKAAVNNQLGSSGSVTISGVSIATVYGYAADATDLEDAMELTDEFTVTTTLVQHNGALTPADCSVAYAPAANVSSVLSLPTFTTTVTGC